jgi:hypothetical protein
MILQGRGSRHGLKGRCDLIARQRRRAPPRQPWRQAPAYGLLSDGAMSRSVSHVDRADTETRRRRTDAGAKSLLVPYSMYFSTSSDVRRTTSWSWSHQSPK